MKDFKFKDESYDLHKLILLNKDISAKEYQTGNVIDTRNNKTYDINDLIFYYHQEIINLLNDNILDVKAQNALMKICKSRNKDIYDAEIFSKLENNTITLIDIDNFLSNFHRKDKAKFGMLHYKSFQTFNSEATKPNNLSNADYGVFLSLALNMNHNNKLAHNNGKPISKLELMNKLRFKSIRPLERCLLNLKNANLIKKIKYNKHQFIVINPYYTTKQIRIDTITYAIFKDDINKYLTALENKYMELLYQAFTLNKDNNITILQ